MAKKSRSSYGVLSKVSAKPLTRLPEADETKTMTVHGMVTPRVRATVKAAAAPSSALDLCGCIQRALLATRRRHGVQVQEHSFADALFTQGLMALMTPTIWHVRAQSAREFVTEFSGSATLHRSGVWLLEL